jgi:nitroreductase
MAITKAMRERHTVRRYADKPIPADIVQKLEERIALDNDTYGTAVKLMVDDARAFNAALKLVLAKGVRNYLILSGDDAPDLEERLGWCSADIMLYAQELGLNSWWVGGTFSRGAVSKLVADKKVIGIVALGYGVTQGKPHKSKTPDQVSEYKGEAPVWFKEGVEAALLAPTALNRQAFRIEGEGDRVSITYEKGAFSGADLGLVRYHFEVGAGKENFQWA